MANNLGRDKFQWTPEIWADIDKAVMAEVSRLRVAQKVFPASTNGNGQYVPADKFDRDKMMIADGTKPYIEISVEFRLTQSQVDGESTLHIGRTLAQLATKSVAMAEDILLFQGHHAQLPANVKVVNHESADDGLLGGRGTASLKVRLHDKAQPGVYGSHTFQKVTEGIGLLIRQSQPGPYALILESSVYADASAPLEGTMVTTADRLEPLLQRGFYSTGALPERTGLLVSVGGDPTTIFLGQDVITAYTQLDADGNSCFRVFERFQLVAREPEALLVLSFEGPAEGPAYGAASKEA
jgi:uncharacterized linocin/CFP29 family protein